MRRRRLGAPWSDPGKWFFGMYYSRQDPRFVVPANPGRWYWTLNLAQPRAYAFAAGLLTLVFAPLVLAKVAVEHFGFDGIAALVLAALFVPASVVWYCATFAGRRTVRRTKR